MVRTSVRSWVIAAASLWLAGPALAQGIPATPASQPLLRDVGTWDAEIVRWGPGGAARRSRGVEITTLGCDNTCLVTRVEGGLAPPPPAAAEPTSIGERVRGSGARNQYGPADYFVTPFRLSPFNDQRAQAILGPVPPERTTVEYPSDGTRVVTMYGRDRRGREVRVARIAYTRRVRP